MDTKLMRACDNVHTAMFIAKFTVEEVDTLNALKRLIDNTLAPYERKEG